MRPAGVYHCMASNTMGESKSREARMTVHETLPVQSPSEMQIPADHIYYDEEADYIVMHCVAVAPSNEQRTRVIWTHNGQVLSASAEHIEIFDNGTLVIHDPIEKDEGNYQCATDNSTVANYELNGKTKFYSEKMLIFHDFTCSCSYCVP